jgi:hypothetical protein
MFHQSLSRGSLYLVSILLIPACEFGEIITYELQAPDAVDLEVRAITPDSAVAQALGWSGVGVPGARVRIALDDEDGGTWTDERVTDEAGVASFAEVPVGSHAISIERELSPEEREAAAALGAVSLLVDDRIHVSAFSPVVEVLVPASLRRSLVISEFHFPVHLAANQVGSYHFGGFIELYNNADTTIYLDGKIIGQGFEVLLDMPPLQPCNVYGHVRADPGGIWSIVWERFPGSGTDHPLAPGEAVVIATDAIDHRPFAPSALDLRIADFEFRGPGDVDNPAVPDMIPDGLLPHPLNRGLLFAINGVAFVADPVVTETLERITPAPITRTYARVPVEKLLDVVVFYEVEESPEFPLCQPVSHPSINRGTAQPAPARSGLSVHRKVLTTLPDGSVVLQHTRTSSSDFFVGPPSPGAP